MSTPVEFSGKGSYHAATVRNPGSNRWRRPKRASFGNMSCVAWRGSSAGRSSGSGARTPLAQPRCMPGPWRCWNRSASQTPWLRQGAGFQRSSCTSATRCCCRSSFGQIPSRYQFILALPQNKTEAILTRRLEALGGRVRRGQEAVGLVQDNAEATVTLRDRGGFLGIDAGALCGGHRRLSQHGPRSRRHRILRPGTYAQTFMPGGPAYGLAARLQMRCGFFWRPTGLLLVVPFTGDRFRIVATVPEARAQPTLDDVQAILDQRGPQCICPPGA